MCDTQRTEGPKTRTVHETSHAATWHLKAFKGVPPHMPAGRLHADTAAPHIPGCLLSCLGWSRRAEQEGLHIAREGAARQKEHWRLSLSLNRQVSQVHRHAAPCACGSKGRDYCAADWQRGSTHLLLSTDTELVWKLKNVDVLHRTMEHSSHRTQSSKKGPA